MFGYFQMGSIDYERLSVQCVYDHGRLPQMVAKSIFRILSLDFCLRVVSIPQR